MANPNFAYPGAYSGFIPRWEASGQLIAFTRDPKTFKINKYAQYVEVDEPLGVYAVLDADQPARVVTDDDFVWPDGSEAPHGNENLMSFVYEEYRTVRKSYPFTIGHQAEEFTPWKLLAAQAAMAAQQCMTGRTLQTYLVLNGQVQNNQPAIGAAVSPSTVWGSNTSSITSLVPGVAGWYSASDDVSSPNYLAIKKSLYTAFRNINVQTNGIVQMQDLLLVLGPDDALAISETSEVHDYVRNTPYALDQLRGNKENQNQLWGLPSHLYGFEIVVEDATRVNNRVPAPGGTLSGTTATGLALAMAAGARNYIWTAGSCGLLSRKGGIDGQSGAPSYSTLQIFLVEEMTVETFSDAENRRTKGRVVEDRVPKVVAPAAGYWFTGVNH